MQLLAKEPEERPESAQVVAEALQAIEGQTDERTARPRPKTRQGKSAERGAPSAERRASGAGRSTLGPPRSTLPWLVGMAGGLLAAIIAGIMLFWPTPHGVVKIESEDPSIEIVFDKTGPSIKGTGAEPITLGTGEHGVLIKRGEFEFEAAKFVLKKGATITLRVELLPGKIQVKADGQVIGVRDLPAVAAVGVSPGGPLPKTFTNSLGMEFVLVPKGKSWLGGGGGKFGDKEVEIPQDFYLGKHEVTQEEWQKVTGVNPSHFSREGPGKDAVKDIPDADLKRFPVEMVSWNDAQLFLKLLNAQAKEAGWEYRLPKEAEWEYACRGGPLSDRFESAFDFYTDRPMNQLLPGQANFEHGKGLKRTCKVGAYPPNRLGLYDMHGNVWEWCDDADGPSYRVYRGGGSWGDVSRLCRAVIRYGHPSAGRSWNLGLRVARIPVGKEVVKFPPEEEEPAVAAQLPPGSPAADSFVPLFNGKDLIGWKTHSSQPGNWRVENGILIGSGPATSHLYTERGDYQDFHLRVEARINDGGNSGVSFRAPFGPRFPAKNPAFPAGFEAQINSTHKDPNKTGSLFSGGVGAAVSIREAPVSPGEWFTEEVIAEGNHFLIKVNGKTTADYTDQKWLFTSGHVALQQHNPQTVAEFRKIEIKELRPGGSDPLPAGSVWKGTRTYRKGWWEGATVSYEVHVRERDGKKFKGLKFDNGPRRNQLDVVGQIDGDRLTWREGKGEWQMEGRISGDTIRLTFKGEFGRGRTEGDGELKREGR
jgi:formylglycine-generating enzyme required for sulfatase activity